MYELYHTLNKKIPTKRLASGKVNELIKNINSDERCHEIVLCLIIEHHRLKSGNTELSNVEHLTDVGFNDTANKNQVDIDFKKLDSALLWIIYKYIAGN